MNRSLPIVSVATWLVVAGCAAGVDVETERQTLLDSDRAFAAAALAEDLDQVFSYWTDDAAIYPAGMPAVQGKDAIRGFVAGNRAQPGFSIRWEPHEAVVSQDGSLGYTIGDYEVSIDGPDLNPIIRRGRYLQTWRKDESGSWRCVVEIQAPLSVPDGPDVRPGSE